jgi:hypothetical protein
MIQRHAALGALLAALFALQFPLCAAACSGPGTAGHTPPVVAAAEADPHPCHENSDPVEETDDCGASCLHEAQAAFAEADAPPGRPALALDRIHRASLSGCRDGMLAPASSHRAPRPPDILLLKSTLVL